MLKGLLPRFLGGSKPARQLQVQRQRLHAEVMPSAIYAIGDIHGCHHLQLRLEQSIITDATGLDGEKWIVCLGDYIDRGPASARVLDHLLGTPPAGFRRICLAGNHEEIAFDFLRNGNHGNGWLDFGGRQALASYGLHELAGDSARIGEQLADHIPETHIALLGTLPAMLTVPGYCFVHAGIDPSLPLDAQSDQILLWSRPSQFAWPEAGTGFRVIHGHTPVTAPDLTQQRINIDFGAYATGRLGAIKVTHAGELSVIMVDG